MDRKLAGGGAFFDTGVYSIQAGCYLTGETPIRVLARPTATRSVYPAGIEETMSVILEFPSGAVMNCRSSYAYNGSTLVCNAENGAYSCEGDLGGSVFAQSGNGKPNRKIVRLPGGKTFKEEDTLQLAMLLDEFAFAIVQKKPFLADGPMGLRDVAILEATARSAESGQCVQITAAK